MTNNLKNARFCNQYSQIFAHKTLAKQAEMNSVLRELSEEKAQLQQCHKRLQRANEHFNLGTVMPEVHRATLNHVATLAVSIDELNMRISELESQRKSLQQELMLLKLKQQVTSNKSDQFKRQESARLTQLQEKQLEQLWVINKGNFNRA
ncbi:hypothetical protein [Pseudoalteromonas byunsanensis]|uniref:Uncharacterized protein n=1 Tax=Pseudoalteromonas byunsanensis TaxID=327939 RepID=A0A1S1NEX6_9GAMM|nr:hypothetical protein [Pseudoalteromonas byunsanensis]OHU97341.1 hypothetical protein BIW53_03195 [Pseudoalteromonas byunsanensis]